MQDKNKTLEILDEVTIESDLTQADVNDIADKINESARNSLEENEK